MLDPLTAATVVNVISWVLTKAGDKLIDKAGDQLISKAGEVYDIVKKRFEGDEYAGLTLLRLEDEPQNPIRRDALQGVILEKARADVEFATLLVRLLEEVKQLEPRVVTSSGDHSVAIGGDVSHSNINTGNQTKEG